MANSRTIPDKIIEARFTGKEITVNTADGTEVTFTPDGLATFLQSELVYSAGDVGAVALPETPAAYSIDPAAIAAVLVSAGLMAAEE